MNEKREQLERKYDALLRLACHAWALHLKSEKIIKARYLAVRTMLHSVNA